jgi:hypothetical protein
MRLADVRYSPGLDAFWPPFYIHTSGTALLFCFFVCMIALELRGDFVVNTLRRRTCFLSQTFPVSRNFVTSRCIVALFRISLPEYALLNASRTTANDFDAK